MAGPASPGLQAVAGAAGGMLSYAATYPLATVSMRLQVQEKARAAAASSSSSSSDASAASPSTAGSGGVPRPAAAADAAAPVHYRGALDAVQRIVRDEGVAGLYAGLGSALFGVAASQGVFYFAYAALRRAALRRWAQRRRPASSGGAAVAAAALELPNWANIVVSSLAGAATAVATNPIWVVNTRLTVRRKRAARSSSSGGGGDPEAELGRSLTGQQRERAASTGAPATAEEAEGGGSALLATVMELLREEGPVAFFRGVLPALALVSNPTIQYAAFERLKGARIAATGATGLSSIELFLLGVAAKAIATVITYPYIVAKTVLHTQSSAGTAGGVETTLGMLARIAKEEGPSGLYRGMRTKLVQSTLTAGILFLSQERITNLLTAAVGSAQS